MNEWAHYIRQERFPAQEIIVPVGGYCYGGDVGEGFYENKLKEVEVSAVAGAGPTPQLEPRQDGGRGGGGGGGGWPWPAWTRGDPHGPGRQCY